MIKKTALSLLIILVLFSCKTTKIPTGSHPSQSRVEYIRKYKDLAIEEMRRTGVPASITLAQGLLESGDGNSYLAVKTNNHFGIKCHNNWNGKTFRYDDDKKRECFRKYKNVEDSYRDHSDFLRNGSRYAFLFKLDPTDYKAWARGLKKAGYATHPHYTELLIGIIQDNRLYQYDRDTVTPNRTVSGKKEKSPKITVHTGALLQGGNYSSTNFTIPSGKRKKGVINRINYFVTIPGDSFSSLALELGMMKWELPKYNELPRDAELKAGMILFLQPKRNQAEQGNDFYRIKTGETMWMISQKFGIKLSRLYEMNKMNEGEQPEPGTRLWLRNHK